MLSPVLGDAFGQERVMRQSAELLMAEGHEVFFVGSRQEGQIPRVAGVEIIPGLGEIRFRSPRAETDRLTSQALQAVRRIKPDLVHFIDQFHWRFQQQVCDEFPSVFTAHLFALTCPSSLRATSKFGICTKKSGWMCLAHHYRQDCLSSFPSLAHRVVVVQSYLGRRRALRNVRAIIAVSKAVQATLIRDGWPEEKVKLIYNPITQPAIAPSRQENVKNLLLFVARLVPYKGLGVLIEALHKVRDLEWELRICGEGPSRKDYEALVKRLNLAERIHFLGRVEYQQTLEWMASSLCVIQPNAGPEPFGLAVAEASLCGRPVVAADLPALNEIIQHEHNGLLFPAGNVNALAGTLRRILTDSSLANRLGKNGPSRIRNLFSPEAHLRETLALYQNVLGEAFAPMPVTHRTIA